MERSICQTRLSACVMSFRKVRARAWAPSCLDSCGGKHHPLPTLPHHGGGLLSGFGPQPKTFLPKNIIPVTKLPFEHYIYTGIDILNGRGIVVVGVGDA